MSRSYSLSFPTSPSSALSLILMLTVSATSVRAAEGGLLLSHNAVAIALQPRPQIQPGTPAAAIPAQDPSQNPAVPTNTGAAPAKKSGIPRWVWFAVAAGVAAGAGAGVLAANHSSSNVATLSSVTISGGTVSAGAPH